MRIRTLCEGDVSGQLEREEADLKISHLSTQLPGEWDVWQGRAVWFSTPARR